MFHHVAVFRFKPEVSSEAVERLTHELTGLATELDGLVSYACGVDLDLRETNADFAVSAVFDSSESMSAYLEHPKHRDIVATHVTALVADRLGAQFSARPSSSPRSRQCVDQSQTGERR